MSRFLCCIGASLFVLTSCSSSINREEIVAIEDSTSYAEDLMISRFGLDIGSVSVPYEVIYDFDSVVVLKGEEKFRNQISYETDTSEFLQTRAYVTQFSEMLIVGRSSQSWTSEEMLQLLPVQVLSFRVTNEQSGDWETKTGATAGKFLRLDVKMKGYEPLNCVYLYSCPDLGHIKDSIIESRRIEMNKIKFLQ